MRLGEFVGLVQAFARWWNALPPSLYDDHLDAYGWYDMFRQWLERGQPRPGEPLK